jgi:AraC-like DNA-binding protein
LASHATILRPRQREEERDPLSAPLAFLIVEAATVVCALLLASRSLLGRPMRRTAIVAGLIAINTACSVVLAHQEYGYWIDPALRIDVGGVASLLNLARNATPGLLMLLCFWVFTDGRRIPASLLTLVAVQLALEEPIDALIPEVWPYARLFTETLPALLQTLFVGFALYWTVADWRSDLIERRRGARLATFSAVGVVTLASGLLTRVVMAPDGYAGYLVHVGLTASYLAILLLFLWLTEGGVGARLAFTAERTQRSPVLGDQTAALARLTALLEEERIYEQEGLTLNVLARRADLPEYRLRRLIHEHLGYRNFNALLHDYRIRWACAQLGDPGQRRTPILTIALTAGYASVNTFNRGFRQIVGVTPSAYRTAALAAADAGKTTPFPEIDAPFEKSVSQA